MASEIVDVRVAGSRLLLVGSDNSTIDLVEALLAAGFSGGGGGGAAVVQYVNGAWPSRPTAPLVIWTGGTVQPPAWQSGDLWISA